MQLSIDVVNSNGHAVGAMLGEVLLRLQVELCLVGAALVYLLCLRRGLVVSTPRQRRKCTLPVAARQAASPDEEGYSSRIRACGSDVSRATLLWQEMLSQQEAPDSEALISMVDCLVRHGRTSEAWTLANEVWAEPDMYLCANRPIYASLLRGFSKAQQDRQIWALFQEMKAREVPLNTISYNTILNSLTRSGQMHHVPEVLAEMEALGTRAAPDIVTYSTIIKGHCLTGNLDKGLELLDFVRHKTDVKPDQLTYNGLLIGCARQRRTDTAIGLLEDMLREGVAPTNHTMSIVIKLLGHERRLTQAFTMVEQVPKAYGFQPNIQVYTCLIQACIHSGDLRMAFKLYNSIVERSLVAVDEKMYTVLARGCIDAGAIQTASLVVRCAYHLPGEQTLRQAPGKAQGVQTSCLQAVLAQLAKVDRLAAEALVAELSTCAAGRARCDGTSLHHSGGCGPASAAWPRCRSLQCQQSAATAPAEALSSARPQRA